MSTTSVCESCLEWALEEGLAAEDECELLCQTLGDEISDHLCEEIETAGTNTCGCACHHEQKLALRKQKVGA